MSDDRVTRGIDDFAAWAGISRSTVYRLVARGIIRTKKIGRRRLVIVASYLALIDKRSTIRPTNRWHDMAQRDTDDGAGPQPQREYGE